MSESSDVWADDLLGRQSDARLLIDFLVARSAERKSDGRSGAYVLNLNAPWGHGKTFFLERLKAQLEAENHLVATINAWRDDAAGEPLVAVMASIEKTISPYFAGSTLVKKAWHATRAAGGEAAIAVLKGAAVKVASKVAGEGFDEAARILTDAGGPTKLPSDKALAEDAGREVGAIVSGVADRFMKERIEGYRKREKSVETFKRQLAKLALNLNAHGRLEAPLFILIDELDRCRPSYAVTMLEEVKHLFDIDGLVFIFATDTKQLSHAVSAVYGSEFDGERYLLRFFNRNYVFDDPTIDDFISMLFRKYNVNPTILSEPLGIVSSSFFSGSIKQYGLSLRDAEQCFDILRSFVSTWNSSVRIELLYLMPIICAFQQGRNDIVDTLGRLEYAEIPITTKWEFVYNDRSDPFERSLNKRSTTMDMVLKKLFPQLKKAVYENTSSQDNDFVSQWISQIFQNEFSALHGNRYTPGVAMPTIMAEYASRVRKVGRLTENKEAAA